MSTHKGQCYCRLIQFEIHAAPLFTQYCHCNKCREIASASQRASDKIGYSHTVALLTKDFLIITGKESLEAIRKNNAILYQCSICKSQIYGIAKDPQYRQTIGLNYNNFLLPVSVPSEFKPIRHVYYSNRTVDFSDNLPKFQDMPKELGGSGKLAIY